MSSPIESSVTRRSFVGGLVACGAGSFMPMLFAEKPRPLLRFGVVSDVHIGGRKESSERLAFALQWLKARDVDAVLFPGDIAHLGQIWQMEAFADIWYRVFPKTGPKVELMISTGNHDAWERGLAAQSEAERRKNWLFYADNAQRTWRRLFDEDFKPVWRKAVKGYMFMGSQWQTFNPDLEGYMAAHRAEFDREKPFFHCQHEPPKGTCHGLYGGENGDKGLAARAFVGFPNAVVFSGHSHCSLADERAVWQGAFTSIGAGCLHEGGYSFTYDNGTAFWHPSFKTHIMKPLNDPDNWGGDPAGGCFEMVDVYSDHLVVARRSSVVDLPIGPDWIVPIPAGRSRALDFDVRRAEGLAPVFGAGARLQATLCPEGSDLAMTAYRRVPCIRVTIPPTDLSRGSRVFSYGLRVLCEGREVKAGQVCAAGCAGPREHAACSTDWIVLCKDLPARCPLVVTATPSDCFGRAGLPLSTEMVI